MFGLSRYQWLVLFAAWLGWGFDVFDALLFNYVAPICLPNLLGYSPTDPAGQRLTWIWGSGLTSLLLIGWATGGILFGRLTDRIGRTRTLLVTMLTYAFSTAACAFAPNIYVLAAFRFVAALGIGGEWAAGAALVAETLPKDKRVLGGALLYTSAPAGLFLATYVNDLFTRQLDVLATNPDTSWRAVFLTGLVPAAVALAIRFRLREPEAWKSAHVRVAELFTPKLRRRSLGGLAMAVIALVTWWSCSAFIPMTASYLTGEILPRPEPATLALLKTRFITTATTAFNLGGLLGTLLTVPFALRFGRRPMLFGYFTASAFAILWTFGAPHEPLARLYAMFTVGLTVFGVFGAFTFYLPELFPSRLRGTGSGFCYNAGRYLTAPFPIAVGWAARAGLNPLQILSWVTVIPAFGVVLLLLGVGEETRGTDAELYDGA